MRIGIYANFKILSFISNQQFQQIRITLLLALSWLLAACGGGYTIQQPEADTVHTDYPALFEVAYEQKPAQLPAMVLNGLRIEQFFNAGANSAVVHGRDLADYFIEGENTFAVNPPLGPSVKFVYDTEGPSIILLGAEDDGLMNVEGIAIDEMGVDSIYVNGTRVFVWDDGRFTVKALPADIYTYVAEDSLGRVKTTEYATLEKKHSRTLAVNVSEEGLDFAIDQSVNIINKTDLNDLIAGAALYDKTWKGLFGETYGPDAIIQELLSNLSISKFDIDFLDGNKATFNARIEVMHLKVLFRYHNGFIPPTPIRTNAKYGPIEASGTIHFNVSENAPDITLTDVTTTFGKVDYDNLGSFIEPIASEVSAGILNLAKGYVGTQIGEYFKEKLDETFSMIIQDSYKIRLNDGVNNHDLAVSMDLESLKTTNHNLTAEFSGAVIPVSVNEDIPQPLAGALYTKDQLPPANIGNSQFAISINSNLINQTLASAHSIGLTQISLVGGKVQFGVPRDVSFGGEDAKSRIIVNNVAPATITIEEVGGVPRVVFSVYEMELFVQSKQGNIFKDDIGVKLDISTAINVAISEDNTFELLIPAKPDFILKGFKLGNGPWSSTGFNKLVNETVDNTIGLILKELTKPIASIKLPAFACMGFKQASISAVGEGKGHLNISGALEKVSDECDVEIVDPPKVAYGRGAGTPLTCSSDEEYDAGLCYTPCRDGYNGVGPVCWKEKGSYGRGVGTIPTQCGEGEEKDVGLCYEECRDGYDGRGPLCWNPRKLSYGRGVGTIPSNIWTGRCPEGKENDAGLCYKPCRDGYNGVGPVCWLKNASYGRGVGTIPKGCRSGEENDAGLCYPVCRSGYHGIGPVCWSNDSLSYGRGVGKPIRHCREGEEKDGLLCYEPCREGYNGRGPVCWPINND